VFARHVLNDNNKYNNGYYVFRRRDCDIFKEKQLTTSAEVCGSSVYRQRYIRKNGVSDADRLVCDWCTYRQHVIRHRIFRALVRKIVRVQNEYVDNFTGYLSVVLELRSDGKPPRESRNARPDRPGARSARKKTDEITRRTKSRRCETDTILRFTRNSNLTVRDHYTTL